MIVANTIQGVVIFEYFYLLILLISFLGGGEHSEHSDFSPLTSNF